MHSLLLSAFFAAFEMHFPQTITGIRERSMLHSHSMLNPAVFSTERFPLGTVVLLLLTYIVLGSTLAQFSHPWTALLLVVGWIILRTLVLIFPRLSLQKWVFRAFGSDALGFTLLVIAVALVSIVITWIHFFLQILLIVAAETLARINLRAARFNGWKSFFLLSIVPVVGVGLGWMLFILLECS
jgi:hypothetical protein